MLSACVDNNELHETTDSGGKKLLPMYLFKPNNYQLEKDMSPVSRLIQANATTLNIALFSNLNILLPLSYPAVSFL